MACWEANVNDRKNIQANEKFITSLSPLQDQDIYSFIEANVREVCCQQIEKLQSEASASYANEATSSLQSENDTLRGTRTKYNMSDGIVIYNVKPKARHF